MVIYTNAPVTSNGHKAFGRAVKAPFSKSASIRFFVFSVSEW
ncbi:hypothetical protein NBRC111894_1032 [Sporolactobacillus inulinus]|uniref:Uncharacterized protein n=1 Tax=Sporolactobacillus inulinus TaxID=2078 RepID=A0A4Y1Z9E8_9BACL|nr:hypothetical protein NBRC111894_1032 [Sporolactobacillus inulinus]